MRIGLSANYMQALSRYCAVWPVPARKLLPGPRLET
jgi:hypothetical protein